MLAVAAPAAPVALPVAAGNAVQRHLKRLAPQRNYSDQINEAAARWRLRRVQLHRLHESLRRTQRTTMQRLAISRLTKSGRAFLPGHATDEGTVALLLARAAAEPEISQTELGRQLGMDRRTVSKYLRLGPNDPYNRVQIGRETMAANKRAEKAHLNL